MSYLKRVNDFLLIGELAEIGGVSRDTLRYYERKGVLPRPARSSKGYRHYSPELIERVKLIRRALAVGFTIDEIARIFAERRHGNAPCREVYLLAAKKLENVKERLRKLETMSDDLENLVSEWDKKLEKVSPDKPVHLLEDLAVSSNYGFGTKGKPAAENLHSRNKKEII